MQSTPAHAPEPEKIFIRLPRVGEREPLTGLSRSHLNALILPTPANNFSPQVRSYVLRKPGARTGVRLIDVASLTAYITAHEEKGGPNPSHAEGR
jgi:hypothetical protein